MFAFDAHQGTADRETRDSVATLDLRIRGVTFLTTSGPLIAVLRASHPEVRRPRTLAPGHDAGLRRDGYACQRRATQKTGGRGRVTNSYTYSDWNESRITCLFLLLENE
jgi:hypothetical protein